MAPYSRAYKGVCGNGCSQMPRSMRSYNSNCAQTTCQPTTCANGGVSQRENFNDFDSVSRGQFFNALAMQDPGVDCTPKDPYDYTNHMPVRNNGRGMTLGRSDGGAPGCSFLDASVNPYHVNNLPAVYGWSALGGGIGTYLPRTELRVAHPDALTNQGRNLLSMDEQYAKHGHTQFNPKVPTRSCY